MKRAHRPQRTCLGCGLRDEQGALLRLVVRDRDRLEVDRLGAGRGGYLHGQESCWEAFLRRKSVFRAFHKEIGREAKEALVQALREERRNRSENESPSAR